MFGRNLSATLQQPDGLMSHWCSNQVLISMSHHSASPPSLGPAVAGAAGAAASPANKQHSSTVDSNEHGRVLDGILLNIFLRTSATQLNILEGSNKHGMLISYLHCRRRLPHSTVPQARSRAALLLPLGGWKRLRARRPRLLLVETVETVEAQPALSLLMAAPQVQLPPSCCRHRPLGRGAAAWRAAAHWGWLPLGWLAALLCPMCLLCLQKQG